MHRNRVMDAGPHSALTKQPLKAVTLAGPRDVKMVDMISVISQPRRLQRAAGEGRAISPRDLAASGILPIEVAELDAQNRRLHLIEAAVHPTLLADIVL